MFLLRSAMCDLLPPASGLPGVAQTDLDGFLARLAREASFTIWATLVVGAVLFVLTPVLTVYVPLPSFLLPRRLRELHADRIVTTRFYLLRQSIFLLKMYACICWGQDSDVRRRLEVAPYPADPGTFRAS